LLSATTLVRRGVAASRISVRLIGRIPLGTMSRLTVHSSLSGLVILCRLRTHGSYACNGEGHSRACTAEPAGGDEGVIARFEFPPKQ
jgi:hypothetical protein